MLSFKNFIKLIEANLIGPDSPFTNRSFRVDPKGTGRFYRDRTYAITRGVNPSRGEFGSSGIEPGQRPTWSRAAIQPKSNVTGVMTTENPEQLINYMFPRGTHIASHQDPVTGQKHISVTSLSPEHEKQMRNASYTVTSVPSAQTKEMPRGFKGERIMPREQYNRTRKGSLKQEINDPVGMANSLGYKVTFRSPDEQKNHIEMLKAAGINPAIET